MTRIMSSEGGFLGQPKLTTPQTCSGRPRNTASSSSAVGIQSRKPSSSQQAAGCVLNENTNGTPRQSSPPNSCVTGLESNHTGYHKKRLAVFIVTLTLFLDLCLMTVLGKSRRVIMSIYIIPNIYCCTYCCI